MFQSLRKSRNLLMGLAICGIAFYHAPFVIHNFWLQIFHDSLYCGVDLFLFLSGIGACHSLAVHSGREYLRRRGMRILPGLYGILIPWSCVMAAMGIMNVPEFFGSVTLVGWWLGQNRQLNWYFSAVWMFFLLAIPCYRCFCRAKHPGVLWLALTAGSVALGVLCPWDWLMTAVTRLPVFLTGMLFGRLEQTGFSHERGLRIVLFALIPVGLWLVLTTCLGYGYEYGYSLGLWWYPYALIIPGGVVLLSDLAALLRRSPVICRAMRPLERCGESSAEILMVHMGLYKIVLAITRMRNRYWLPFMLGCIVLGCLYHYFVTPQLQRAAGRWQTRGADKR